MNILESVEKILLPRIRDWDAKDFFNRIITEKKGEIPPYFFPLEIWGENKGWNKPLDFSKKSVREMFWHASVTYSWMITKAEYVIPEILLPEILRSEFNGKLPLSVLRTIPHWTGYVNLSAFPIKQVLDDEPVIDGIFLSTVTHWGGKDGLTICYPYNEDGWPQTLFFPFDGDMTLEDVVREDPTIIRAAKELNITIDQAVEKLMDEGYGRVYTQLLNIALFVAQEYELQDRADFRNTHRLTQMKRTGKRYSLRFLNAHRKFPVGEDYLEPLESRQKGGKTYGRVTHVRRAHWHGYWTGARNSDHRQLKIKWIRASVVSGNKGEING